MVEPLRGALARSTGVGAETIRYYERIGLMPQPNRSAGGHRLYSSEHRRRLRFIKRCRELDFSLDEIRRLLGLVDSRDHTCAEVRERAAAHLCHIEEKLRDLRRMQEALARMISSCDDSAGAVPDCPIVDELFST